MMGVKMLLLVSLLAALGPSLPAGSHHGGLMPGSPYNISRNDPRLQKVVLTAAYYYNNQSNDAFLFKPSAIQRAQRQLVKGVRYIVDLQISRTVCHKRDGNKNLSQCDLQPAGVLQQTFQCHFEVWIIPWEKKTQTQVLDCGL
ncbi:cystatin-F [Acanthopagrus latus]|uniref:cystatin-F n=1 Tax=Acanthopagrus latus TaxID=8177 RepID=UPI00187CAC6D|nr:cystatin-F [Acanthopagrus latus]